jgi:hypothetical protein
MGERFRLKASFNIAPYPADVQVILRAMKRYGIILADNGSAWYISGKPDPRWNDDNLHTLSQLLGSNFEAVDATVLRVSADSGAARQTGATVAVSPSSASVRVGRIQSFVATVTGATGGVTWTVNGVAGGDGSVGTIDSTGRYLAPATVPAQSVTVRATSVSTPTASGSAAVTVLPLPVITSVSPASIPTGAFTLTIDGSGFTSGGSVSFGGTPLPAAFVSSTRLTVSGSVAAAGSVPLFVTMTDGAVSSPVNVTVTASPPPSTVTVSITPTTATLRVKQGLRFTATVAGASKKTVVWKVNGITGGNSTVGRVGSAGLYTAPTKVPTVPVTVSATSIADPTKSATAKLTITR